MNKQQSSDAELENEIGEKKKKSNRHKWVPLEIDISKGHSKREVSPRQKSDRSSDMHATMSDGDGDHKSEKDKDHPEKGGRHTRPSSAANRGRGRNRGGRKGQFNRQNNRVPNDQEYSVFSADFPNVIIMKVSEIYIFKMFFYRLIILGHQPIQLVLLYPIWAHTIIIAITILILIARP